MSSYIDITAGQWVLAFNEPFGPMKDLAEHLENFSRRGGGWDHIPEDEILHLYRVSHVMRKTYHYDEVVKHYRGYITKTQYRFNVIAAGSKDEMLALRKRLFAIGVESSDRIEAEMYRRIEKFSEREQAKAVKRIHRVLPQIFGRYSMSWFTPDPESASYKVLYEAERRNHHFEKERANSFEKLLKAEQERRKKLEAELAVRDKATLYCSFCGKSQREVRTLIAGPTVFICDECTLLSVKVLIGRAKP
jgi:hypothetical protein